MVLILLVGCFLLTVPVSGQITGVSYHDVNWVDFNGRAADPGNRMATEVVPDLEQCRRFCLIEKNQGLIGGPECRSIEFCPLQQQKQCTLYTKPIEVGVDPNAGGVSGRDCTSYYHVLRPSVGDVALEGAKKYGPATIAAMAVAGAIGGIICLFLSYKAAKSDFIAGRTKSWWARDSW